MRLGWACSSSPTAVNLPYISMSFGTKKKRVRVEPSGRCAKPHWEVVATSWPRRGWRCGTRRFEGHPAPAHPLPPFPSSSDGQPDLAPKARVRRGRKTRGPVAIPCGERESPNQLLRRACPRGTPATLSFAGCNLCFNEEKCKAGGEKTPNPPKS